MSPKVIDLFAGAGGFSLGFEQEGFDIILANEYNPDIAAAYEKNHKVAEIITGDIRLLPLEDVFGRYRDRTDVIIGGPPCQGFSQKGKRNTGCDERNFLFQYYVKAVELVNPRYFVMENVPNILTAEGGYFAKEIERMFCAARYQLRMGILNAADFGVPQNRRRAFVIGKRDGAALDFPKPSPCKVTVWDAISDLAYLESGEGEEEQAYCFDAQSDYQRMLREKSAILYNHRASRHSNTALERMAMIPPNAGKEVLPKEHLTKSVFSGTWTRMAKDEVSVTCWLCCILSEIHLFTKFPQLWNIFISAIIEHMFFYDMLYNACANGIFAVCAADERRGCFGKASAQRKYTIFWNRIPGMGVS